MVDRILNILVCTPQPVDTDLLQAALGFGQHTLRLLVPSHLSSLESTDSWDGILVRVSGNCQDGLRLIATIKRLSPSLPILAYGDQWQVANVVQALKLGADEVCEFPGDGEQLASAVKRMVASKMGKSDEYGDLIPKSVLQKLSSEEARILHLLVQGRTTKEVGATLDVSIRTVHYRKKEMLRKLGVRNRSEAIELIRFTTGNLFGGLSPSDL